MNVRPRPRATFARMAYGPAEREGRGGPNVDAVTEGSMVFFGLVALAVIPLVIRHFLVAHWEKRAFHRTGRYLVEAEGPFPNSSRIRGLR